MSHLGLSLPSNPWLLHRMAVDDVQERFRRITAAFCDGHVPHAVVGGQAVAAWVSTKDPDAVRVTKDVDILLDRGDLPQARAAALSVEMDYFEVVGVGMFLERANPNPRRGVHLLWAGEKSAPTMRRRRQRSSSGNFFPPDCGW